MSANFYFRGVIRPYIQGRHALEVINQTPGFLDCYLGSKRTRIRLRDFRPGVRQATEHALKPQDVETFLNTFGQPARVKIRLMRGKLQIDLHESAPGQKVPFLWLGVVNNGETMPLVSVTWEIFRAVSKSKTSFAMLMSIG